MNFLRINRFLFLNLASILIFCTSSSAQDDWIVYKADAILSFEVQVPAEMGIKTKKINTDLGVMTTTTYAHESPKDAANFLYVVNIVEYPPGTFPVDSTELAIDFLSEALQSIVEGLEGDLVYQSELNEEGNGQGILFRLKYNDGYGVIKGKTYIKDDVFITLQVYTTKDKSLNDEMNLFLDSFKTMF